jgi:hypothetical protein
MPNTVINNANGTSQVQITSGLPSGISSEYQNFSQPNGTGTLTELLLDYTSPASVDQRLKNWNGSLCASGYLFPTGSIDQIISGLPGSFSNMVKIYSGPKQTGNRLNLVNYTSGSSQIGYFYNLPTGIIDKYMNYSGFNGTGIRTNILASFTNPAGIDGVVQGWTGGLLSQFVANLGSSGSIDQVVGNLPSNFANMVKIYSGWKT